MTKEEFIQQYVLQNLHVYRGQVVARSPGMTGDHYTRSGGTEYKGVDWNTAANACIKDASNLFDSIRKKATES